MNNTFDQPNVQIDCIYSAAQIKQRVHELAVQIDADYSQCTGELVLVGLLNGAVMFLADLSRALHTQHRLDFMQVGKMASKIETAPRSPTQPVNKTV